MLKSRYNKILGISVYILIVFSLCPLFLSAQLSSGGNPLFSEVSRTQQNNLRFEIPAPDINKLEQEDLLFEESGLPERMGMNLPVSINPASAGIIVSANGSEQTWLINLRSTGAYGLGLYFSEFSLPEGARMFVYSEDKKQVLGSYTSLNNQASRKFAIEVVKGESLFIEYTCPLSEAGNSAFEIGEVLYVYKPMFFYDSQTGDLRNSGSCEVNAACSEGDNWRKEIKSVVRILIKNGNASYWCTGTLMNNTSVDFSPLLITADHCARSFAETYATPADVSQWIFYFIYETPGCQDEAVEDNKSLTGAVKLASSSPQQNNGSDFYLVQLNDIIPADYEPYYAGWDNTGSLSNSGVGIHHPAGDVKKISTYTEQLAVDQWGQVPGTHFRVVWAATENGHGVTEGGSSGSPLFNAQGRFLGQLTGGESGCSNLTGADFYGRLSFSWESNGTDDSTRLKPWLDPDNTGISILNGSFNENRAVARFIADTTVIPVGSSITFSDLSAGSPSSWLWEFEGGTPSKSTSRIPEAVTYNRAGVFNVTLTVSNQYGADSLIRENYIRVAPLVFPNPTSGETYITLGDHSLGEVTISITNTLGRVIYEMNNFCPGQKSCMIDLSGLLSGFYSVKVRSEGYAETAKLIIVRN
ncbi:MAG: PKD domain-containing protein [Lentimicrobium sp.]|nr:PKD domain-containing protein [Lentimicrobium sp.]